MEEYTDHSSRKAELITSPFLGLKIHAALFLAAGVYFIFYHIRYEQFEILIIGTFLTFSLGGWHLYFSLTRNKVWYDKSYFYIYDWKGREVDVFPLECISSMFYALPGIDWPHFGLAYRLFYDSPDGYQKQFWIYPKWRFYIGTLKRELRQRIPDVIIVEGSFGFEHLVLHEEHQLL